MHSKKSRGVTAKADGVAHLPGTPCIERRAHAVVFQNVHDSDRPCSYKDLYLISKHSQNMEIIQFVRSFKRPMK